MVLIPMKRAFEGILFLFLASALICSCRTAQQARRNPAGQRSNAGSSGSGAANGSLSRSQDSLLMVERRLVQVIDSLTSLVQRDHSRLKALEDQLNAMRAQRYPGGGLSYRALDPDADNAATAPSSMLPPPRYYTAPAPTPRPPVVEQDRPTAPMTPASSPFDDRYVTARRAFMENNFDGALQGFRSLEQEDPHGVLAPNYLYWQGESLYALKRYNEALQEFSLVVQEFPGSNKADDAQFKIAECYERLGLASSARSAYELMLSKYPWSANHDKAEARLRKLR